MASPMMAKHVAVVGGGFVGLSCALHLQRVGCRVTLLDRDSIGSTSAASYGNAGTFAAYANVPVNKPGIVWDLPKLLLAQTGPLSIKPTPHLLRMVPWFAHFLRNCTPHAVEHTSLALGTLLMRAEAAYDHVWEQASLDIDGSMGAFSSTGHGDESFSCRNGYLLLQKSKAAMEASMGGAQLRRRGLGPQLRMEALSQGEVLSMEPNLNPYAAEGGAWWFPDGWFLKEPAALIRAMAAGFEARGGEIRTGPWGAVTGLSGGIDGVALSVSDRSSDSLLADEVVVAAGAHSAALARSVGDWCPLDTERGHHVAWAPGSEALLTRAVCDPSQGYITSPMAGGLRSAGTVELGGISAGLTPARCSQLEVATTNMLSPEAAQRLGPRLPASDWLGYRPSMPDALPVIGRSTRLPQVIYAFGHQHVGWTLGGITGQLVAELVRGQEPCVALKPFQPDRFGMWRSGSASARYQRHRDDTAPRDA